MRDDKGAVYVTTYTRPDKDGRQSFMLEWWSEGFHLGPSWRGQCFNADLSRTLQGFADRRIIRTHEPW